MLDCLGKQIGTEHKSSFRKVYLHKHNPNLVIKTVREDRVEKSKKHIRQEWEVWEHLKYTDRGIWLCPAIAVAPDFTWIVMLRAETFNDKSRDVSPFKQSWMRDAGSLKNWGWINGQPVLVDYGHDGTYRNVFQNGGQL
jgi:hypothetical protein